MLEREREYYDKNREAWERRFPGRFLLVKGEALLGDFGTVNEALAEGARSYGMEPFLVRRVGEEREISIPALTLGLLNAKPPRPV